jgi:hypothetical protein
LQDPRLRGGPTYRDDSNRSRQSSASRRVPTGIVGSYKVIFPGLTATLKSKEIDLDYYILLHAGKMTSKNKGL